VVGDAFYSENGKHTAPEIYFRKRTAAAAAGR
jgi:hypothetical protein